MHFPVTPGRSSYKISSKRGCCPKDPRSPSLRARRPAVHAPGGRALSSTLQGALHSRYHERNQARWCSGPEPPSTRVGRAPLQFRVQQLEGLRRPIREREKDLGRAGCGPPQGAPAGPPESRTACAQKSAARVGRGQSAPPQQRSP